MRLLLDTHVVLWALGDRLPTHARSTIEARTTEVHVSAASVWEIEVKRAKGRLQAPEDLLDQLEAARFSLLRIDGEHATAAARLPPHHADPFDRILIAQALIEGLVLCTADAAIGRYDVPMLDPTR